MEPLVAVAAVADAGEQHLFCVFPGHVSLLFDVILINKLGTPVSSSLPAVNKLDPLVLAAT
jgi:hypothetical protein